jgi:hypothetical protein
MNQPETITQLLKSLGYFKDASNYLLVTTVGALGWVSTREVWLTPHSFQSSLICFCISIICGIFTLALIPIVGQNIKADTRSIYEVQVGFKLLWLWGPECRALSLKRVCWLQHMFFISGIIIFTYGAIAGVIHLAPNPLY